MNQRTLKAFVYSLAIHLVLALLYFYFFVFHTSIKPPIVQEKISLGQLNIKDIQTLLPSPPPMPTPPIVTPMPPEESTITTPKTIEKPSPIIPEKSSPPSTTPQKKTSPKKTQPSIPPSNAQAPPSFYHLMERSLENELKELYGQDFYTLDQESRDYLDENYRKIYLITQRNLKYPLHAGKLGLQGNNKIEFFLHPNGNITGLRVVDSSGYELFDKNSLKTIEISYKDYPHPSKPLKIIFYIRYKIRP